MTRERIDHAAEARVWAENAVKAQAARGEQECEQLAAAYAGIGQVHATLALVEQQRIANLLAFWALPEPEAEALGESIAYGVARRDIREGLGL